MNPTEKQTAYDKAVKAAEAMQTGQKSESPGIYKEVASVLAELGDFADAPIRAREYEAIADRLERYREAIRQLDEAKTPEALDDILSNITDLMGFRDTDARISAAMRRIEQSEKSPTDSSRKTSAAPAKNARGPKNRQTGTPFVDAKRFEDRVRTLQSATRGENWCRLVRACKYEYDTQSPDFQVAAVNAVGILEGLSRECELVSEALLSDKRIRELDVRTPSGEWCRRIISLQASISPDVAPYMQETERLNRLLATAQAFSEASRREEERQREAALAEKAARADAEIDRLSRDPVTDAWCLSVYRLRASVTSDIRDRLERADELDALTKKAKAHQAEQKAAREQIRVAKPKTAARRHPRKKGAHAHPVIDVLWRVLLCTSPFLFMAVRSIRLGENILYWCISVGVAVLFSLLRWRMRWDLFILIPDGIAVIGGIAALIAGQSALLVVLCAFCMLTFVLMPWDAGFDAILFGLEVSFPLLYACIAGGRLLHPLLGLWAMVLMGGGIGLDILVYIILLKKCEGEDTAGWFGLVSVSLLTAVAAVLIFIGRTYAFVALPLLALNLASAILSATTLYQYARRMRKTARAYGIPLSAVTAGLLITAVIVCFFV